MRPRFGPLRALLLAVALPVLGCQGAGRPAAPPAPAPAAGPGFAPVTGSARAGSEATVPVPTAASLAGGMVSLGEARARILDRANLRLVAEAYRTAEAQGQVYQAALPPNPYVMLRKRRLSDADVLGTGITEVEIGQPIELGRKRGARVAQARAEAATVSERVRALTLLTLHDTEAWFYRLLRLQQDVEVAREAEQAAHELEDLARTRYESGKDSRVPVLRFQAAAENARLAVQDVERQQASACRRMDQMLGLPVGTTQGVRGTWERADAGALDRSAAHRALDRHPRRRVVDRDLTAARRAIRRADADVWPNVTVGLVGERDSDLGRSTVGLSLYVPVPLWNKNEGNRVAARAAAGRARATVAAETLDLAVELDRAILTLERAGRNVEGYEQRIIPVLDTSVSLARSAYEGGRGSYLDVLDALLAWIRARRERIGHLEQRAQGTVAIRYLTGML